MLHDLLPVLGLHTVNGIAFRSMECIRFHELHIGLWIVYCSMDTTCFNHGLHPVAWIASFSTDRIVFQDKVLFYGLHPVPETASCSRDGILFQGRHPVSGTASFSRDCMHSVPEIACILFLV
jgi:hypothetical protein